MTIINSEFTGIERGVLAFDAMGQNDLPGIVLGSFDSTNAPDIGWEVPLSCAPAHGIEATLHEAFSEYDDLLRRLAE